MIRMRNVLLLLLGAAAELVHASSSSSSSLWPIVTKSSRRLQAPIIAECNAQLILNAEDGTTVTTDVVLNFINGFFGAEYESFDVLHIRIQLAFFFQSGMDRTIEVNEGDENGVSLISIFCNDLAELFMEGGLLAPSASPTKPSLPTSISTPTKNPTPAPTASPTKNPTPAPTASPTKNPTPAPTASPTKHPTPAPTASSTMISTSLPPTDSCADEPNWVDSFGDGCDFYETNDACDFLGDCCENDGYTANTACCYCQGLSPSVTPIASPTKRPTPTPIASPTKQPTATPTASPTTTCDEDDNWTDRFGDGCDWYRINDPECLFTGCCGNVNTGLTPGDVCCHCQDIDLAPTPLLFKTGMPTINPTLSLTPTYLPSIKPSLNPTTSIYPTLTFTPTFFPSTKQSLDPTNVINSNSNDKNKSSSDDIEDILADYHIGAVVIGVGVIVMVYMIAMGKLGGLKEDKDNGEGGTSQSFDKVEVDEGYTIRDLDEHTMKFDPAQNANKIMTSLSAMTTESALVRDSTPPGLSDNQDNPKLPSPQASATNFSVKFDEFDDSQTSIIDNLGLQTKNDLVRAVDLGQWTELSALADSLGLDDTPGGFSEEEERYEMSQDAFTRYKSAGQMVNEPASTSELDKKDEEQKLQAEGFDNDDLMNFKATNPKHDFQILEEYEGNEEDDDDEMLNMMPPIVSDQLTNQKDEEQLHMKAMSTLTNSGSLDENLYTTKSTEIPSYDIVLSSHSGDGESNAEEIQNSSTYQGIKEEVEETKISYDNEKKKPIYKVDSYDNESIDGIVSEVDEETIKRRAELYTLLNSAHPNNSREENEKLMNNTINQGPEAEVDLLDSLTVMVKMMERESGTASKSPTNEISGGYSIRSTRSDMTGFETFD